MAADSDFTVATDRREIAERIIRQVRDALTSIRDAASLYVQILDQDPGFLDYVLDHDASLPRKFWTDLEGIGRKSLDHRLFYMTGSVANRLRRLSYSQQKLALDQGIEVLTANGEILRVQPENMDRQHVKQVFAPGGIRSPAQQKSWLEAHRSQDLTTTSARSYTIKKDRVHFNPPVATIGRQQLLDLLKEMS